MGNTGSNDGGSCNPNVDACRNGTVDPGDNGDSAGTNQVVQRRLTIHDVPRTFFPAISRNNNAQDCLTSEIYFNSYSHTIYFICDVWLCVVDAIFDTIWRQNCLMLLKRTLTLPVTQSQSPFSQQQLQCVLSDAVLELVWDYWMHAEALLVCGGFGGMFSTGVRLNIFNKIRTKLDIYSILT